VFNVQSTLMYSTVCHKCVCVCVCVCVSDQEKDTESISLCVRETVNRDRDREKENSEDRQTCVRVCERAYVCVRKGALCASVSKREGERR